MKTITRFSLRKRILSFTHAIHGIAIMLKYEHNSRIYLITLLLVTALGLYLRIAPTEWATIAIVSGMVLVSELINSAIEDLADIVNPEWDEKIGRIKDYTAGAVLVSAIVSIIAGLIIFIPKILILIKPSVA